MLRPLLIGALVLAASVLIGTWLAPPFPSNDPCGVTGGAELTYWPAGTACSGAEDFQGSWTETSVWIVVVGALIALALRFRHPALRGAVGGAGVAALALFGFHSVQELPGSGLALVLGVPLVAAVDLALAAPGQRRLADSLLAAIFIAPIAAFVWACFGLAGYDATAVAATVVAASLVAGVVDRQRHRMRAWFLATP